MKQIKAWPTRKLTCKKGIKDLHEQAATPASTAAEDFSTFEQTYFFITLTSSIPVRHHLDIVGGTAAHTRITACHGGTSSPRPRRSTSSQPAKSSRQSEVSGVVGMYASIAQHHLLLQSPKCTHYTCIGRDSIPSPSGRVAPVRKQPCTPTITIHHSGEPALATLYAGTRTYHQLPAAPAPAQTQHHPTADPHKHPHQNRRFAVPIAAGQGGRV